MVIALLAGLAAGAVHVLSGPDHLAAVAPLTVDQREKRWRIGLTWGLGHAAGVGLIGALALVFHGLLPVDELSSWGERWVGVALIGLGLLGLTRALRLETHAAKPPHKHTATAFGALHGVAGSSHLLGVLPALGLGDGVDVLIYLAGFGAGSVAGMVAFAAGLGALVDRNGPRAQRTVGALASSAAMVVGVVWLSA